MNEHFKKPGIYSITNIENGKRYIGRTIDLHKREETHFWALKNGRHPNCHLQRAFNEGQPFKFEVIEFCDPDVLNEKEIYWISHYDSFKNGYNQCSGGAATLGRKLSDESKAKMSASKKGKKRSREAVEQSKETLRKHLDSDPEFRQRYHESLRGHGKHEAWNKGRPHTEAEKKNLSEKLKGRTISVDHKNKLRKLYSGEGSLSHKLTKREVIEIRLRFLYGESQTEISKDYPITHQTVYDIVKGRRWQSLPNTIQELEEMKCQILNSEQRE